MSAIKKRKHNIVWEEGSKNVFADLDMPDAEEKLAKAKLAFKINEIINKKQLKQADASKLLELDQSKISLLNRGNLKDFSVERLAHLLTLLNQDVDIVIKKTNKTSGHGVLRVVYA
jgi:predicted XRE-type DNA-binding protein